MNQLRSILTTATLLATACGLLVGCSNPDGSAASAEKPASAAGAATVDEAAAAALPQSTRDKGTLVVTMSQSSPPLHFMDGNTTVGVDPELAAALGQTLGLETEVQSGPFDGIIPGISAGKFDMAISQMSPSAERMKVLDFLPQRTDGTAFASLTTKNLDIEKLSDLCGHSVGDLTGSADYPYLVRSSKTECTSKGLPPIAIKQFATQAAAELAVTSGRVELVAGSSSKLAYASKQRGDTVVSKLVASPVYICIGLRKNDALGSSLADALQKLIDTGAYQKIMDKWGVGKSGLLDSAQILAKPDANAE